MKKHLLTFFAILFSFGIYAQTDLIISEYVEGWSNNKAIEVFNPTNAPINLKNYRLTRYSNGAETPPAAASWFVVLPDVELKPFKSYVLVIDKRNPAGTGQEAPVWEQLAERADAFLCPDYETSKALYHNGDDALALEKSDGTLVDLFARWGPPRPAEATMPGSTTKVRCWTNTAPYFTGVGIGITADHTLVRKPTVTNGIKSNPASFNPLAEWDSLSANTFHQLGWHKYDGAPANATPVFTSNAFQFKVWKQSTAGKVIGTISATDAENDALKYFINKGNFIYNNSDVRKVPFALDAKTGVISVADAGALLESTWDTLFLSISVTDGFSETEWKTATVILSDTNVSSKSQLNSSQIRVIAVDANEKQYQVVTNKFIKTISVIGIDGKTYLNRRVSEPSNEYSIDLSALKGGIYIIQATFEDLSQGTQRLVVK